MGGIFAQLTMGEDGISVHGHVLPDLIVPTYNHDSISSTGVGLPFGSLPSKPCDACRGHGEKVYCTFDTTCENLNNPLFNTSAPAKLKY